MAIFADDRSLLLPARGGVDGMRSSKQLVLDAVSSPLTRMM
jgi:hypothetical protein